VEKHIVSNEERSGLTLAGRGEGRFDLVVGARSEFPARSRALLLARLAR
jgi:hypothetical protein